MCLAVSTSVLIAFLFTITIRYLYQGGKIEQIDWDMATVTAGDYTVEFTMKEDKYRYWKQDVYEKPGGPKEQGISPALALKLEMTEVIESTIDEWVECNPAIVNAE